MEAPGQIPPDIDIHGSLCQSMDLRCRVLEHLDEQIEEDQSSRLFPCREKNTWTATLFEKDRQATILPITCLWLTGDRKAEEGTWDDNSRIHEHVDPAQKQ
jgi:hypothetical protein